MKKRMNSKSQSGIITTVLLISIVIVSIIIIWNIVYMILKNSNVSSGTDVLTTQLEIKQTKLYVTGGAEVQVHRGSGKGDMTGMKFIFENKNNERKIVTRLENISELETRNFVFNVSEIGYNSIDIKSVYVVPIFGNTNGMEIIENTEAVKKDVSGNRIIDTIPTSAGLVSWWKFDGNALDNMGINNGVINGTTFTKNNKGNDGSAMNFNGTSYVSVTNAKLPILNEPYSIFVWVNPNNCTSERGIVDWGVYGSNFNSNAFILRNCRPMNYWWSSDPLPSTDVITNIWSFVGVTYDGTTRKYYLNSNLDGSYAGVVHGVPNSNNFTIGMNREGGAAYFYFNGSIDNVMIFNRSLNSDEITALYNNQK